MSEDGDAGQSQNAVDSNKEARSRASSLVVPFLLASSVATGLASGIVLKLENGIKTADTLNDNLDAYGEEQLAKPMKDGECAYARPLKGVAVEFYRSAEGRNIRMEMVRALLPFVEADLKLDVYAYMPDYEVAPCEELEPGLGLTRTQLEKTVHDAIEDKKADRYTKHFRDRYRSDGVTALMRRTVVNDPIFY